jgi:hypothetical protein
MPTYERCCVSPGKELTPLVIIENHGAKTANFLPSASLRPESALQRLVSPNLF